MAANELEAATGFVEGSDLTGSPGCNLAGLGDCDAADQAFGFRSRRYTQVAGRSRHRSGMTFLRIVIPLYLFI
jgi:hypothetical protein